MSLPFLEKDITCCFAGHRPHKYGFELYDDNPEFNKLSADLYEVLERCYADGYRNYICGGAMGFDIMSAEYVVHMKERYPDIKLYCILPFEGQAKRFSRLWLGKYNKILESCDYINYISPVYVHGCYFARTEKTLELSSRIVIYYGGKDGGTDRCLAMAQFKKLDIINLCDGYTIPQTTDFFIGNQY